MDVLLCDYKTLVEGADDFLGGPYFQSNSSETMTGREFIVSQKIPWVVWSCAYKRDFLLQNDIRFEENIRFEDVDFLIKSIIVASGVVYRPIELVVHTLSQSQTTQVNNDADKITDLFRLADRIKRIGIDEQAIDPRSANAVMGHHLYMYKSNVIRYLWRLSPSQIFHLLQNFRAYTPTDIRWLSFSARHPRIFAGCLVFIKPLIPIFRKLYLSIK